MRTSPSMVGWAPFSAAANSAFDIRGRRVVSICKLWESPNRPPETGTVVLAELELEPEELVLPDPEPDVEPANDACDEFIEDDDEVVVDPLPEADVPLPGGW